MLGDFLDLTTVGKGEALVIVDAFVALLMDASTPLRRATLPLLGRKRVVPLSKSLRVALLLL
ncbi:hypothetical protein ACLOJK_009258 [Asimina triloba]